MLIRLFLSEGSSSKVSFLLFLSSSNDKTNALSTENDLGSLTQKQKMYSRFILRSRIWTTTNGLISASTSPIAFWLPREWPRIYRTGWCRLATDNGIADRLSLQLKKGNWSQPDMYRPTCRWQWMHFVWNCLKWPNKNRMLQNPLALRRRKHETVVPYDD